MTFAPLRSIRIFCNSRASVFCEFFAALSARLVSSRLGEVLSIFKDFWIFFLREFINYLFK